MKKTSSFIVTTLLTLLAFGAIVYNTSCKKDQCSQVTCFNGGNCQNGYCTCPYGYEGDHCEIHVKSTIEYLNHSQTDITLTLNNVEYTVPAGLSKGFEGGYGDTLQGNAFTHGYRGVLIKWDTVMNTFPINGTLKVDLNVSSKYFFAYVRNDSASGPLKYFTVNKDVVPHGEDSLEIPIILDPPYLAYQSTVALGYFKAVDSSNVYVKSAANNGEWWFRRSTGNLYLPMTANQVVTLVAN